MATEIELTTKINTANSAKSIGELRSALKDLVSIQGQVGAGSKDFEKLSKAINDTEGKLGDLNDSFNTIRGSGVERLTGSLGLLKEGLLSADPGKVGIAFKGLSAAMSAVPIFLLIEGFKALVDNFDAVVGFIKNVTGAFSDEEKQIKSLTKELEENKKINVAIIATLTNSIKILEAQGASEEKIIASKKQLTAIQIKELEGNIELQKLKIRQIITDSTLFELGEKKLAQLFRLQGKNLEAEAIEKKIAIEKNERIKDAADVLRTDFIAIQNLKTEEQVSEIKLEKQKTDRFEKSLKDRQDLEDKARQERFRKQQEELKSQADAEDYLTKKDALDKQQALEEADALAAYNAERLNQSAQLAETILTKQKADRKQELEEFVNDNNARLGIAQSGIQSLTALSDLAFSIKQANTAKGTKAEENAARQQFKINKTLQISNAGISGAQGVLMAATQPSGVPAPFDIPFRVAKALGIGLTTASTIAKISATQFNNTGFASQDTGASAISNPGTSTGPVGSGAVLPQNIQSQGFNFGTIGQVGQPGGKSLPGGDKNNTPTVSVVEINKVNNKVRATELQAKFG